MRVCIAKDDVSKEKKSASKRFYPVVISAKRFDGIKSRARQEVKLAKIAAVEEERHYRQYLIEGNDLLCSYFKENVLKRKGDAENQNTKADEIIDNETKLLQDHLRRERILRANKMLERLKPGQRAIHQALLQSDMIHQRQYHEALNREIAKAASDQQKLDEKQCPEILIPFANVTEAELVEKEQAKVKTFRNDVVRDICQRQRRKEEARLREVYEGAMERAQCEKMVNEEKKAAEELKARKHDFARKAYRDALKEKAEREEHERVCDAIDERRNCVYQVASRNLSSRYNAHVRKMRADLIASREARAIRVCQMQQANKRNAEERQCIEEDRYDFEVKVDEERRQCELAELAKQRKAYQLEERRLAAEKRKREKEIQRFEMARRFKNSEVNKHFDILEERNQEKEKLDLRKVLYDQRDEFLEQRRLELMRISACNDDPYLEDDKNFFAQAVDVMEKSREVGRPLYPIAMAADRYRRQNNLDMRPEARVVRRSKLRDCCWPGFVSKADLAYRKYEQRKKCQEEVENDRHQIYCDSIKIAKMAAVERPYQPCQPSCPIKCFRHDGYSPNKKVEFNDFVPVPPVDTSPKAMDQPDPKTKMLKVIRKVIDEVKNDIRPSAKPNEIDVVVSVPVLIQVSSAAAPNESPSNEPPSNEPPSNEPPSNEPPSSGAPPKVTKIKKKRNSQTKQKGFGGGPPPGQDYPADIPNPKGTWGQGPLKSRPVRQVQPAKRPSGFTGGPPPGQNRAADIPNPKGTWGEGPLRSRPVRQVQPAKRPSGFTGGPPPGQNRPADIPNPKGTWGEGPLRARPARQGPSPGQNRPPDMLPQSRPPVQPPKRPAAGPPAGQNIPAPIPNPKGTWGSGPLRQPPNKKGNAKN